LLDGVITNLPMAVRLYVGSLIAAVTALVVAFAPHSVVARGGYWTAALVSASLYLAYRANKGVLARLEDQPRLEDQQRHVQQMSDLHLATIEALALAIDAKDEVGQRHVRHMQIYAAGLAKALGMSDADIQGVTTASLLHDIGKLAVPEHILSKPGPLTQEEFQKIRIHPQVGAEIIGGVPFPYPVAPLILCHHERWDGNGYPEGLAGERIPLGARILTLVDHFDALISERPHQRAVGVDAALALLREESGKALDPRVVETFIRLYPTLATSAAATGEQSPMRLKRVDSPPSTALPARADADRADQSSVFHDIALAHREIYALYEIAQAIGSSLGVSDTMALIASKLSNLVPFSCCALFLRTDETGTLRCRFACGTDADLIQELTIRDGQGLSGWVGRNRRALVNARPQADLEAAGQPGVRTSLQSALVCPLVFNGHFIGTISVYHTEQSVYTDDHRRLLDRISEQAAAVIHHSIVFEQTQEDSLTDPMTGLPNTRYMLMHLTRELARAGRLRSEVSLIVMDLDRFKEINDRYGHQAGDRALREVAGALRAVIRPYDICVRYAGDEFIVVLPGCGGEEAERKRLDLQGAIDELRFEVRAGLMLPLAISAGAAVFPHDGQSYDALLATADSRMYRDKTARKRLGAASRPEDPVPTQGPEGMSELDLTRAASGIL
jgi:diguanylate cyclase (GGDEF)-like protein